METVQMIAVVLFAVLVGVAVPALLQLRRTLRRAEEFLETTGPRLDITLDEVSGAAAKIRAVAGHLEEGSAGLHRIVETVGGLMGFVERALASIRAWRAARREPADGL
jgi:ABC-type transporter Mla subunit MlaD